MSTGAPGRGTSDASRSHALVDACRSLDQLASALESCDLNGLSTCVPNVEAAALALRRLDATRMAGSPRARQDVEAVASALARCRRLGASLADALRVSRAAHAAMALPTYGPRGDAGHATARTMGRAVDAHV